jgi:hypothetical protein
MSTRESFRSDGFNISIWRKQMKKANWLLSDELGKLGLFIYMNLVQSSALGI